MSLSEGMVAVVTSAETPGGLCVTLKEGNRQYTLMPNSEVPLRMQPNGPCPTVAYPTSTYPTATYPTATYPTAAYPQTTQATSMHQPPSTYNQEPRETRNAYDHATQAVDGQYASIYKMAHCNLHPTSPPLELTEFPPQRPELCPGQNNFVIGGCGSRDTNQSPPRNGANFRMGNNWPAQAPSPSSRRHRPDAFSKSLRNYPSMSPERSAEIIERLVNYSNIRNNKLSPDRLLMPKNHLQSSKFSNPMADKFQQYDNRLGRPARADKYDESPTRDSWQYGEENQRIPRCDIRSMTEDKLKDFQSVYNSYTANLCPTMMERLNHIPSKYSHNILEDNRHHSVNMETQAAVPTVSKEMATVPRSPPEVRNVAVFVSPESPSPSNSDLQHRRLEVIRHSKSISIQTQFSDVLILRRKSVQTCLSSINLRNKKKVGHKRRSKSQVEINVEDDVDEQIFQIIQDLTKPSGHLRSKLKKLRTHKHDKRDPKPKTEKRENEELLFSERHLKEFTRDLYNDLLSKIKRQNIIIHPTDYRANYSDLLKTNLEQCFFYEILIDWLNNIPIKHTDYLGRPVVKENILKTVGDKVQNTLINKLKYINDASTKADIIDILEDIPIDVTSHTRRLFLNKLVTELISKVKNSMSKKQWKKISAFCYNIQPADQNIKQFIGNEVTNLQRKFSLLICQETVGHMIGELTDILLDSMETIRCGKIRDVIDEVLTITSEFLTISEFQSIYFAHNLVYNLFQQSNCNESRPFDFLCYSSQIQETLGNSTDSSAENETEQENSFNKSDFASQVAIQVNEWLSSIEGIENINSSSRLVVVNGLTGDIIDRKKYLDMNPSVSNAEAEELEHLKYQIYKSVNKVLGEDNTDTLFKAPYLLTRIKSIPVTQTASQEKALVVMRKPTDHSSNVSKEQRKNSRPDGQHNQSSIRPAPLQSTVPSAAQNKSIKQLNEEYDAYVKDWVKRVPIAIAEPLEEAIVEKARLGLYIGVWKAITKLKMSPETLDNPYHYQDALDDELEILLQCLPQTTEFKNKKHVLKPELIEKTMIFNERVANVTGGSSYRQQLVNNVSNNLPKQTDINLAGKNANRLYEEWQKNTLAELYILYNRFKIDDRVKAIAYKKKLMRHVEKMIDNIKETTKQELQELDHLTYQDEILAALDEVPIPSNETLNEEAGEILILLEIEQWFRDLPLLPSKRETAHMEAKVFQDLLARKLYDIDAHSNPTKRTDLMKQEIRRFLERLPLREEEKPNMNFMIDELHNRLNNVNSDVVVVGGENERKSVNFLEGYDYDAFSRNLPVSSTFQGNPPRDPFDGSSYLVSEGARVPDEQNWQMIRDPSGRSEQYLTIEGLTGPRMQSRSASPEPPTPQNVDVLPSEQLLSPHQGPFRAEQTKNDSLPGFPGSGNVTRNGEASSRSIQIMEDPVSNQSGYGSQAVDYDPNRLQPLPVDINNAPMPQQYRTSSVPSSKRVDCCSLPTPQDNGVSDMQRPQQSGSSGTPIQQDNGAYGMSGPQASSTPQDLPASGTYPILKPPQSETSVMLPQVDRASAMPRHLDNRAYSMSRSQSGTSPRPRPAPPSCCLKPSSGAIPSSKEQNASEAIGSFGMSRPQSLSSPQDFRTADQGTNPKPRTQDSGTVPPYNSVRRSSMPPSFIPNTIHQYTVPPTPEPYIPYPTPDNEDLQTPRKYRRESARRKLRFEASENDSDTDFDCRCMQKRWRCRRRKPVCEMRGYIPCEDLPYFMRMRESYYYI